MKKTLIALCLISSSFLLNTKQIFAAYIEFNPKNAQFVSPEQAKKEVTNPALPKTVAKPAVKGVAVVNDVYIKSLVTSTVNDMVAQGLIKGEKGDKGDSGSTPNLSSYDPEATGFQQIYIPGGVIAPDVGTFFAATNLSSDNITSASANLGDIESDGSLTVTGDADLQGNITLATTTVANINVGILTSDSGAYLSDGGDWVNASSKELKENFATTSPQDILSKIGALPIYTWNYKAQDSSIIHIGPTAEDFHQAFGLGGENGNKAISTIDPAGIALSGIQALNQKLNSLLDFSWVLDGFKKLGIEIADGLVKAKQLVADLVQTKELEVGSPDHPTGITIYDRATGEPLCMFSENKVMKMETGKCSDLAENNQQENVSQPVSDDLVSPESNSALAPTTSPDSILPPTEQTIPTTTDVSIEDNQSEETTQN